MHLLFQFCLVSSWGVMADRCQKNFQMAEIGLEHKTDTSVGRLLTGKKISKLVVLTSYKKSYYLRLFIFSCTFFSFYVLPVCSD